MPLRDVMALAADRDLVARQYANGFVEVLNEGVPIFKRELADSRSLEEAIITLHLTLLARYGDSLIARKEGAQASREAARRAQAVLSCGRVHGQPAQIEFAELAEWFAAGGNARNPGTTADLVAACLFACLRQNIIKLPLPIPWSMTCS
jgi:triphosphoribosyl-dephospho-CoA synthase